MKRITLLLVAVTLFAVLSISNISAQTVKTLYTWPGGGGGNPEGNLVFDSAGNLYGTTADPGGTTVFELTPNSDGAWTFNVLWASAGGSDPNNVRPGVIFDASGNLYATSYIGGAHGCGAAFKLTKGSGGTWSESNLVDFDCATGGADAVAGMTFDKAGNLYGATTNGGAFGHGLIFQLTPNSDGSWTENVIHAFTGGSDGSYPDHEALIFDSSDNLYGSAAHGGEGTCPQFVDTLCGTIFKMSPGTGGTWSFTTLHEFTGGSDGGNPEATLVFDKSGNLYGTTYNGGTYGYGVAFKLTPHANGKWGETVLHAFKGGGDGTNPIGGLIFDAVGNLYGSTTAGAGTGCGALGPPIGCGTVYELSSNGHGGTTETVLVRFHGAPNNSPYNVLAMDSLGNLYGAATGYGTAENGSIFEVLH
jgi:uncharacterized repeat protein (TIGR03803 family)